MNLAISTWVSEGLHARRVVPASVEGEYGGHPDRFVGNETLRSEAERKLALINQAFSTLESAGFPRGGVEEPAATRSIVSNDGAMAEPISRLVQTTIWATSVVALSFLFWLGLSDKAPIERLFVSLLVGLIAGSGLSAIVFHVVWSVKARPRTWIAGSNLFRALY